MKKILLLFVLFLTGCSTTIVYSPKYIIVEHEGRDAEIKLDANLKGSEIEDFAAEQKGGNVNAAQNQNNN